MFGRDKEIHTNRLSWNWLKRYINDNFGNFGCCWAETESHITITEVITALNYSLLLLTLCLAKPKSDIYVSVSNIQFELFF